MPKKPETKTASTQYSEKDAEITESSRVIIALKTRQDQNTKNNKIQQVNRRQKNQPHNENKTKQIQNKVSKLSYRIG